MMLALFSSLTNLTRQNNRSQEKNKKKCKCAHDIQAFCHVLMALYSVAALGCVPPASAPCMPWPKSHAYHVFKANVSLWQRHQVPRPCLCPISYHWLTNALVFSKRKLKNKCNGNSKFSGNGCQDRFHQASHNLFQNNKALMTPVACCWPEVQPLPDLDLTTSSPRPRLTGLQ